MNAVFRASLARDLKAIKDRWILDLVPQEIGHAEVATGLQDINDLKKLSGTENCYRIRAGAY
jgi:hypothetical protein